MTPSWFMAELTVADWAASVSWYRDGLGLEPILVREDDRFALFRAGAGRIALKAGKPIPGNTLLTFEVADLATELGRLEQRGITPDDSIKHSAEGYRRILLRDPDGHRVCLFDWSRTTGTGGQFA